MKYKYDCPRCKRRFVVGPDTPPLTQQQIAVCDFCRGRNADLEQRYKAEK